MGEISCRGAVAVWELPAASPPQLSPIRSKPTQYFPVPAVPGAISVVLPEVPGKLDPTELVVYWCSMSLHHSDQMSQGSGCFTNSLCLCLLVNGHWSGHVSSSLWSDVPGSWQYLWVPGGYMSVKEGYKYAVVFPHVSLRGKMYFLCSERSKLTNCIMIKVCELVECRL